MEDLCRRLPFFNLHIEQAIVIGVAPTQLVNKRHDFASNISYDWMMRPLPPGVSGANLIGLDVGDLVLVLWLHDPAAK